VNCGWILTAVCIFDVVAPPISSGTLKPSRFIVFATCTISSSDGVMSPDRPMTSAPHAFASARIFSHGTMTPMSFTS